MANIVKIIKIAKPVKIARVCKEDFQKLTITQKFCTTSAMSG